MSLNLERQVRLAFADVQLVTPLNDVITRGRHIKQRRRLRVYGLSMAVVAATVSIAMTTLPGSQPSAFAGWRSQPTVLQGAAAATAEDTCRRLNGPDNTGSPYLHSSVPARLIEGRGPWAFAVFSDNKVEASCLMNGGLNIPGSTVMSQAITTVKHRHDVAAGKDAAAVEDTQFLNIDGRTYRDTNGNEHSVEGGRAAAIYGWTRSDVTTLRVLTGGEEIDASIEDGVFAAWWPIPGQKQLPAVTIKAYAHDGTMIGSIRCPAGPGGQPTCSS